MVRVAFQPLKSVDYNSRGGNLWIHLFKIYELTKIVKGVIPSLHKYLTESEKVVTMAMKSEK